MVSWGDLSFPTHAVEAEPKPEPEVEPEPELRPEFPDASTTGVATGVRLEPSKGLTISTDGAVIENLHVEGRLIIDADNVTVRNAVVESDTGLSVVHVEGGRTGVKLENIEVDNRGGGGIGILVQGATTISRANIHSAEDGVRIESDRVTVEKSYIHDMHRIDGGHHDSIQIRRGDDIIIRGNNLQAYVASIDDPMNAAIQIGSLVGDDQISNLLVSENYMNGGNYTINGGGRDEVESARYVGNYFGRDFRYGVQGNLQNSVWEDTNVWFDNLDPAQ